MKSIVRSYNLVQFHLVSDTKYHNWCTTLQIIAALPTYESQSTHRVQLENCKSNSGIDFVLDY